MQQCGSLKILSNVLILQGGWHMDTVSTGDISFVGKNSLCLYSASVFNPNPNHLDFNMATCMIGPCWGSCNMLKKSYEDRRQGEQRDEVCCGNWRRSNFSFCCEAFNIVCIAGVRSATILGSLLFILKKGGLHFLHSAVNEGTVTQVRV